MYKIISYEYVVDLLSQKKKKKRKRVCTRSVVYRVHMFLACRDLIYELGHEL